MISRAPEPATGPLIINVSREIDSLLREALQRGDVLSICSHSGLLLEKISNILSYHLPISVTRRKGDKYTLGDLWPGIYKVLRKTNVHEATNEVERWLHLRNLVGSHYNEWAQTLSRREAQLFGEAVLCLLSLVHCDECHRWIERRESTGARRIYWSCRCGRTVIEKV